MTGTRSHASKNGATWRDLPANVPIGRIARSAKGTYICVNRKESGSIKRSTDGEHWISVYDDEQVDPKFQSQRFSHVVYGRVNTIAKRIRMGATGDSSNWFKKPFQLDHAVLQFGRGSKLLWHEKPNLASYTIRSMKLGGVSDCHSARR